MLSEPVVRVAPAKINLCLEILGRRDDGYHEITSVMQAIGLEDRLTFERAEGGELTLECDDAALASEGDANLVLKAARLLRQASGVEHGARIRLEKRIPVAAGLGGGSSDAAATLLGLTELWGLHAGRRDLADLAERLGSDVPFFLDGPTAFVEGRGERVTRIPPPPGGWAVLVCPRYDLPDKTKRLYSALTRSDMSGGSATRALIAALVAGRFPTSDLLFNGFERVALGIFEGLGRTRQTMVRAGGREVHLSGSGPTLFTLYPARQESLARSLHSTLQEAGMPAYLAPLVV